MVGDLSYFPANVREMVNDIIWRAVPKFALSLTIPNLPTLAHQILRF
jgi:hypothetical protein